jgi:nucleoside phosphorylase
MAVSHTGVDFLIVTALPEEFHAVRELLEERQPAAHGIAAAIRREGSAAKYDVALTEIGGMGTDEAQAAARVAMRYWNPTRVILTGIAAGFPEAGVELGDILIPYGVIPYELAKVTEKSKVGLRGVLERILRKEPEVTY